MDVGVTLSREGVQRRGGRRSTVHLLILPTMVLMFFFFLLPYVNMLIVSFMTPGKTQAYTMPLTFQSYGKYLFDNYYWDVLLKTMLYGVFVT